MHRPATHNVNRFALALAVLAGAVLAASAYTGPAVMLRASAGDGGAKEARDRIVVHGTTHEGTLLDITETEVVLQTTQGKEFFLRADVETMDRSADEDALTVFERFRSRATKLEHWTKLASFCKDQGLAPERRTCLRAIVQLEPDNEAARRDLGELRFEGRWLSEKEVHEKLKGGFVLVAGKLVREKSATGVAEKKPPPSGIRVLPRQELTTQEAAKIEADREKRREYAKRFRAKLEREYRPGSWIKHETRHFVIECNSTGEVAKRYGVIMELIRAKLSDMFQGKLYRGTVRAPVKIYANQEDFIQGDDYARWGGRGLGGYYVPVRQSITTYHGTFGFTGTTFSVLSHEGTHYYQGLVLKGGFDNLPIWLIEGLAVYFGDGSRFEPERARVTVGLIPRDRLAHLQEKMEIGKHTKIQDLVAMTRYSGFSGSHYADAWGLIYFLVNHPSKKGETLLNRYWQVGVERKLTKDDFLTLADVLFGGIDGLEKEYVEYIRNLKAPPAGEVRGDYFVSDDFQFEFKAPGGDWQFFVDERDTKLIVGALKPGTSAQVRVYYENNIENQRPPAYFDAYLAKVKRTYENVKHEEVDVAGLKGYKLTYLDTGKGSISWIVEDGEIVVRKDGEEEKKPRDVVKYLLIQIDGVASIECSTETGEMAPFAELYDGMNHNFNLILSRRW